jgi:hypothetical protein
MGEYCDDKDRKKDFEKCLRHSTSNTVNLLTGSLFGIVVVIFIFVMMFNGLLHLLHISPNAPFFEKVTQLWGDFIAGATSGVITIKTEANKSYYTLHAYEKLVTGVVFAAVLSVGIYYMKKEIITSILAGLLILVAFLFIIRRFNPIVRPIMGGIISAVVVLMALFTGNEILRSPVLFILAILFILTSLSYYGHTYAIRRGRRRGSGGWDNVDTFRDNPYQRYTRW